MTEAGKPVVIGGGFDHAGEPRAARGVVVFTAWKTPNPLGDTDVLAFDTVSLRTLLIAGGPAQQRFADVSDTHVALTDFIEDPDGAFNDNGTDLADIVVFDRATRSLSTRARPGKQAFPVLASQTHLGYLDWGLIHPEPKFSQFTLRAGLIAQGAAPDVTVFEIQNVSFQRILPAGRNGVLEWIHQPGTASLWRAPADLSSAPLQVAGLEGLELYAPSAASALTVLAVRPPNGPLVLRGVSR